MVHNESPFWYPKKQSIWWLSGLHLTLYRVLILLFFIVFNTSSKLNHLEHQNMSPSLFIIDFLIQTITKLPNWLCCEKYSTVLTNAASGGQSLAATTAVVVAIAAIFLPYPIWGNVSLKTIIAVVVSKAQRLIRGSFISSFNLVLQLKRSLDFCCRCGPVT